jgi:hypothetical protein
LIGRVEVRIAREGTRRSNLCCVRGSRALKPQNLVRNASRRVTTMYMGLTRATYILCIEHPRPKRLSRESNLGPPALQASTMQRAIRTALLTAIRNLGLYYYNILINACILMCFFTISGEGLDSIAMQHLINPPLVPMSPLPNPRCCIQ